MTATTELDDELLLRVGAFEAQLQASGTARVAIPLLVLPDAPPPAFGLCVSCGEAAAAWRCPLCLEAVEIVLDLADESGEPFPPRAPKINPVVEEVEDCMTERNLWRRDEA